MSQILQMPTELHALLNFALRALSDQRYVDAVQACEAALRLDVNQVDAHHYLSHAYKGLGQNDLSDSMIARALQLAPTNPQVNYNSAVNIHNTDNNRAAIYYQQALRREPNMCDALWNYGEFLRLSEHFGMALACFERLVELEQTSQYTGLWHRMAVCYGYLDRFDDAMVMWERAIRTDNEMLSRWEYALFLLSLEDYAKGTLLYNDRFLCEGRNSVHQHTFPYALWNGVFEKGMTLLLHGEQGLGDEIMFSSMFNELLSDAKNVEAHVVIACKPPLVRLFTDNFPLATVRAHKVGSSPADVSDLRIDAQMAMGHLMSIYRKTKDDFTIGRHAYIKPKERQIHHYAEHIKYLGRESLDGKRRFRVGLMWGSNPAQVSQKFTRWAEQKSIRLSLFADFVDLLDEVEFISLQNFERGSEAALLPELRLVDFSLDQADFSDTAALIANLDLVISVDTSVCHLTGSMAFETWVPLMKHPDWRHGRTRTDSLWYAGTRYFRQHKKNEWSAVIKEMHTALRERVLEWKTKHES